MYTCTISRRHSWLALALLLGPTCAPISAAWLGFRNDTNAPLVLQSATPVGNMIQRDKPRILYPGEVFWAALNAPGDRLLFIYHPKQPNTPLFQDVIPYTDKDVFLAIQAEIVPPNPRGQPAPTVKLKLTPTKAPSPPPGTKAGSTTSTPPTKDKEP